jgi:hypothetical protein
MPIRKLTKAIRRATQKKQPKRISVFVKHTVIIRIDDEHHELFAFWLPEGQGPPKIKPRKKFPQIVEIIKSNEAEPLTDKKVVDRLNFLNGILARKKGKQK